MLATKGSELSNVVHGPGVRFRCAGCGEEKDVNHGTGGTGYATMGDDSILCYPCCGKRDREDMAATGRATLYLIHEKGKRHGKLTNWPGTLEFPAAVATGRHNIAGVRYDVWFTGPDGRKWHGVTYGDNTQVCHCRRLKGGK